MAIPPKIGDIVGPEKPPVLPPTPPPRLPKDPSQSSAAFARLLKFGISALLVLIIVPVLVVKLIEHFNPPEKSVAALAAACKRHDRQTVELYVDAPALASNMKDFFKDAFEWKEKVEASQNRDQGSIDHFLGQLAKPVGYKIIFAIIDKLVTPEHLVQMLSGEPVGPMMKSSVSEAANDAVDTVMDFAPTKKVYAPAIKLGMDLLSGIMVDAAESERAEQSTQPADLGFSEKDIKTTTLYESSSRYVVMHKAPDPRYPMIAVVYERHGLTIWKWSGIRFLPPDPAP